MADRVRPSLLAALFVLTACVSCAGNLAYGREALRGHRAQREQVEAFPVRMGATGVAGIVRVYLRSGGTPGPVAVGIYSDVGGDPGSLLSQGRVGALKVHAWKTLSITPTRLVSNETYWLAVLGGIATPHGRSHAPRRCLTERLGSADLRVLPARWRGGRPSTRGPCRVAAYVVTAGSAAAVGLQGSGGPGSSSASTDDALSAERPATSLEAPASTAAPAITGSAIVGERLGASTGSWRGDPTSYSYQWEDCDALGEGCLGIGGGEASTYELGAGDLGSALRVVVTADNAAGATQATSAPTEPVLSLAPPPSHCFENPEYEGTERIEACHYPGLHNTGVMTVKSAGPEEGLIEGGGVYTPGYYSCQQLWEKGTLTTKVEGGIDPAENAVVQNEWILGGAVISHNHVTLKHDCIVKASTEGPVIATECGSSEYLQIENSDIYGTNSSTKTAHLGVYNACGKGGHQTPVLTKDALWNCGECINGNADTSETFLDSNAEQPNGEPGGPHSEDVFLNGGIFTATKDTLLNPATQTAIVFFTKNLGAGTEPCTDEVEIKESFIAGAGQMFQACPESHAPDELFEVTDSRFARCTKAISGSPGRCKSPKAWEEAAETAGFCGRTEAECVEQGKKRARLSGEAEGFFPLGQANEDTFLGCSPCPGEGHGGTFTWSGNVWDNNLEAVGAHG